MISAALNAHFDIEPRYSGGILSLLISGAVMIRWSSGGLLLKIIYFVINTGVIFAAAMGVSQVQAAELKYTEVMPLNSYSNDAKYLFQTDQSKNDYRMAEAVDKEVHNLPLSNLVHKVSSLAQEPAEEDEVNSADLIFLAEGEEQQDKPFFKPWKFDQEYSDERKSLEQLRVRIYYCCSREVDVKKIAEILRNNDADIINIQRVPKDGSSQHKGRIYYYFERHRRFTERIAEILAPVESGIIVEKGSGLFGYLTNSVTLFVI